jgi:hypothetical protein
MTSEAVQRPPGHAFISYIREDAEQVDRLQQMLEAAGVRVWRDTAELWPGQDWRIEIANAITNGSLAFIACFSENSSRRETYFQNEEIVLAAEQMRLRQPGRSRLIPVRFAECGVPSFPLGAGRTLDSLQRVDLFGKFTNVAIARLVATVVGILNAQQRPMASKDLPSFRWCMPPPWRAFIGGTMGVTSDHD